MIWATHLRMQRSSVAEWFYWLIDHLIIWHWSFPVLSGHTGQSGRRRGPTKRKRVEPKNPSTRTEKKEGSRHFILIVAVKGMRYESSAVLLWFHYFILITWYFQMLWLIRSTTKWPFFVVPWEPAIFISTPSHEPVRPHHFVLKGSWHAPIPAECSHDFDAVFGKKGEISSFTTSWATLLDTSVRCVFIQGLKPKPVYLDWWCRAHLAQLLQIKPAGHRQDDLEPRQWIDWEMLMEKRQERWLWKVRPAPAEEIA